MFDYHSFMPHGHCYLWRPDILWLNVISDGLIALAYFTIPIALFYFARKRKDFAFKSIFILFGLFIIFCGLSHIVEVYTVWIPNYGLQGLVKAITASVSLVTAVALWPIIPRALRLPSPSQLAEKNQELKKLNDTLEAKVTKRVRDSRQLAAIVNSSRDAIVSKNLHGTVITWNKAAEKLFQYSADEMIGQSIQKIIPGGSQEEEIIIEEIRAGHLIKPFDTLRVKKDGTEIKTSVSVSPIYNEEGTVVGASSIMLDISERMELEEKLKLSNEELKKSHLAKDEFIANLSHELRSPLNIILGYSNIIKSFSPNSEDFTKALDGIERSAQTQLHLIEDLLDMSRIISGKFSLKIGNNDVRTIVQDSVESVYHSAKIKNITIRVELEEKKTMLVCDANRLQQILWNLLSNSVKFTPENGQISLRAIRTNGYFEFEVKDNGRGIKKEDIPQLFNQLWQSDEESVSGKGGLGLGLKIVKDLTEAHGGKIEVHSNGPGTGASFLVKIPVHVAASHFQDKQTNRDKKKMGLLAGMNILIVDDSSDALDVLTFFLKSEGAKVVQAFDGTEALEIISANNIDFIISDINMPKMDGHTFIQKTRMLESSLGRVSRPAIALTARTETGDRQRSFESGFNLHLIKPVDHKMLIKNIVKMSLQK